MANNFDELYPEPHSVEKYKGLEFGQSFVIDGRNCTIYRLNDERNEVTLIIKNIGFRYMDVDDFLKLVEKGE